MNSESLIAQIENIVLPQSERPSMPKVDRMFSYLVLAIAALALVSSNLEPGYRVGDNSKDAAGMCAQGGEASFRLLLTHPLNVILRASEHPRNTMLWLSSTLSIIAGVVSFIMILWEMRAATRTDEVKKRAIDCAFAIFEAHLGSGNGQIEKTADQWRQKISEHRLKSSDDKIKRLSYLFSSEDVFPPTPKPVQSAVLGVFLGVVRSTF